MTTPSDAQQAYRAAKLRVLAAMETANIQVARSTLLELEDAYPEQGQQLRMDVVRTYGTNL